MDESTGAVVVCGMHARSRGQLPRRMSFTLFACALFVVLGIVTTLLGPILPFVSARWSLSVVEAGSLFFWQFISSTAGTLLGGIVLARRGFRLAVLLGIALCLIGTAALVRADWTAGRCAIACYGFGLGIALPAINLAVAEANPTTRGASISVLNFAWGIGAITGPLLLRLAHSLNLFLILLSGLVAAGLIASAIFPMPGKISTSRTSSSNHLPIRRLWTLVPLIGFSMFLFCGVENAVAGWASSLALPSFSDAFTATDATVAFWTFFLASRAFAPIVLRHISETRLLLASIVLAATGVLAFYFAAHAATILIACALAGTGVGPGFPLLISRVSELIGPQHPATALCFACAGIGAASLPTLVGLVGSKAGQPRTGLLLPFMGLLVLLILTRGLPTVKQPC